MSHYIRSESNEKKAVQKSQLLQALSLPSQEGQSGMCAGLLYRNTIVNLKCADLRRFLHLREAVYNFLCS